MNVVFCLGTAAELIKVFPVIHLAIRENAKWAMVFTGQSPKGLLDQWDDFRLPREKVITLVNRDRDLAKGSEALFWFVQSLTKFVGPLKKELAQHMDLAEPLAWAVHGDTLSTLSGAILGRRLGAKVAHIEAGLRSGKLREPFPEEIARTLVGQIATLHFPPEPSGTKNLERERVRGTIVETEGNTQLDAIESALSLPPPVDLPKGSYGLVNIHRFETLISPERKKGVKRTLLRAADKHKLIVVAHETTNAWIRSEPEFLRELESKGVVWLPRQPFTKFAHWLANAEFVIADSGGNQEECSYLGIPCLLLRVYTERFFLADRKNIVMSEFREDRIDPFIDDPKSYRETKKKLASSPAERIWSMLRT